MKRLREATQKVQMLYNKPTHRCTLSVVPELYVGHTVKSGDYIISFDSLAFEVDEDRCESEWGRCFIRGLGQYVDWINVMYYNVNDDAEAAKVRAN